MMDNQYATLPIWAWQEESTASWQRRAGGLCARPRADCGGGTLLAAAVNRRLTTLSWSALVFGGHGDFRSGQDTPAGTAVSRFTAVTPPTDALFSDRTAVALGVGVLRRGNGLEGWLGDRWIGGLMWQRVELSDYAANYRVTSGSSTGIAGRIDYSADYRFVTAIGGIEWSHTIGYWNLAPHVMAALPLPQRGLAGRIAGPGFDLRGDTATAGFGHMAIVCRRWQRSPTAAGTQCGYRATLSQIFLEKLLHRGLIAI
jgi:hypothetical protein